MKITCKYCGIVDKPHVCPHRTKRKNKSKDREDVKIYNSKSYKQERTEAMDRYNKNCLWSLYVVGQYRTAETTHHIVEILEDKSKATDIDNLITLTEDAHKLIHKLYKVNNNYKSAIQELLKTLKKEYEEENYDLGKYRGYVERLLSPLCMEIF